MKDTQLKQNPLLHSLVQCLLIAFLIYTIFLFFHIGEEDVLIASVGSSCFRIFGLPHSEQAKSRYVLGGYAVGIMMGIIFFGLKHFLIAHDFTVLSPSIINGFCGALSISFAIFAMIALSIPHPPAVGVAFSLVIHPWGGMTLLRLILLLSVVLLAKRLFQRYLTDLIDNA